MKAVLEKPASELTDAELADSFAEIRLAWKAWQPEVNPHQQRYTELHAELLKRQESIPGEASVIVEGAKWKVPITARENKTTITNPAGVYQIVRRLGVKKVVELYSITLGNARKLLTERQQQKYMKTERTGPREIREPVLKDAR